MANKSKKNKTGNTGVKSVKQMKPLYWVAIVVILIPLLSLGFIYISTKENAGSPTVGERFDDQLEPAITQQQLDAIHEALQYEKAEVVEVNLKSATLQILIDLKDDAGNETVTNVLNDAYKKVIDILPVNTYFTNDGEKKMYDLDIHVYNFIPEGDDTSGWVYKEKIKNAAAKKATTDTLSKPRNEKLSDKLLDQQKGK